MKSKVGLIVGGSGVLGRAVADSFKKNGWRMLNIDVTNNDKVDSNFQLST
jgi:NAD(P)-dependent dehydrogenase (short-subunit alcohol dehydrogenase family)